MKDKISNWFSQHGITLGWVGLVWAVTLKSLWFGLCYDSPPADEVNGIILVCVGFATVASVGIVWVSTVLERRRKAALEAMVDVWASRFSGLTFDVTVHWKETSLKADDKS